MFVEGFRFGELKMATRMSRESGKTNLVKRVSMSLVWLFPAFVLLIIGSIYFTGASEISRDLFRRQLAQKYRVSLDQVERISLRAPGGWDLPLSTLAQSPPHSHQLPADFAVAETGVAMVFAQVADGEIPGTDRSFQTTLILVNDSNQDTTGVIKFYGDNGSPLIFTIKDVASGEFPFTLKKGEVKRFTTSGKGETRVGWARIESNQPITGTCSFGIRDSKGIVLTDAGVGASTLGPEFTIFVDTLGSGNTGVATVNPDGNQSLQLLFELRDATGKVVSSRQETLPPRGHLARYVNELFSGTPGINEFEGSLVIRSSGSSSAASSRVSGKAQVAAAQAGRFAGITLRADGDQLTSLPMVEPPPEGANWSKLALPQVADGVAGGLSIVTSTILINNTAQKATGVVDFFKSDGTPMEVKIGGKTGSSFAFSVDPRGVKRLVTGRAGNLVVGWGRVSMDQPISATALFTTFDAAGRLVTEVGVNSPALRTDFNLIADTTDVFNTGIALAYPLEEGEAQINLSLFDSEGRAKLTTQVKVKALGHTALFLTELFPEVEGIEEFQGLLKASSSQLVAPLSLRSAGQKLTSVPTLTPQHGFAPTSIVQFAQNLAGTAPMVHWTLHQNQSDLALERLKLSLPGLGVAPHDLPVGSPIMFGYFARDSNSRVFQFLVTAIKDRRVDFDFILTRSDGNFRQGTGSLEETASGDLVVELIPLGKEANTYVGDTSDLEFFLLPGLITAPDSPSTTTVTSEFTSVPLEAGKDVRVDRRTTHSASFVSASQTKANLHRMSPFLTETGKTVSLEGTNFGNSPKVIFTGKDGVPVTTDAIESDGETLKVMVPGGAGDGTVQVDNGAGPGNPHQLKILFGPTFDIDSPEPGGGLKIAFSQPVQQFVLTRYQIDLYRVDADLSQLAAGATVGTGRSNSTQFDLIVASSETGRAVLNVVQSGQTEPKALLTLERVVEDVTLVRFTYAPVDPQNEPILLQTPLLHQLDITAVPFVFPPAGQIVTALAHLTSTPTGVGGSVSALQVEQSDAFVSPQP
jgi:hypothetical protein